CAGEADALWTDRPGLGVMGRSADCPILLVAGRREDGSAVWGMAHASWRSTVAGIAPRLLAAMAADGLEGASLRAAIAPSAGPCCYGVGEEVRRAALEDLGAHAAAFFAARGGVLYFDLWAANRSALERAGAAAGAVRVDGRCTICGRGFPSYRREGERAGRFGVVVGCPR
ncbi:polyphenol oxidase family protein, partial [bacterium]|nr:polyphenol oxidase family protein [bacterium]